MDASGKGPDPTILMNPGKWRKGASEVPTDDVDAHVPGVEERLPLPRQEPLARILITHVEDVQPDVLRVLAVLAGVDQGVRRGPPSPRAPLPCVFGVGAGSRGTTVVVRQVVVHSSSETVVSSSSSPSCHLLLMRTSELSPQ